MRPRLKSTAWVRTAGDLRIGYEPREHLVIDDPDGTVAALLELLETGGRNPAELAAAHGIDQPSGIDHWGNAARVSRAVPYVAAASR